MGRDVVQGDPEDLTRTMKPVLHKPPVPGNDYEFIFGVLLVPLFAAASLLVLHLSPKIQIFCLFHRLTGFPCPACGSFRCAEQLAAGHIGEAWLTQPLAATLACLALVYAAYSWVVVLFRLPRLRVEGTTRRQRWLMAALAAAAILANWAYIALCGV